MALSSDQVQRVALLARLRLSDAELQGMTRQLAAIVEYVELLSEANTDEVEPLAHPLEMTNVFRADAVANSLPREQALANAPKKDDECFRVPAVLGD